MSNSTVCVLISTYNGEKFISEQLESIYNQKDADVFLYVRDDGSTDSTVSILKEFEKRYRKMKIVEGKNIGVRDSFMELILTAPEYEYYALSDQDDVWNRDKLASAIGQISQFANDEAVLYYSDLDVVDSKLKYINNFYNEGKTYNKYQILFSNYIPGCSMIFNKRLHELVLKGEYNGINGLHDDWLVWIASFLGKIIYDDTTKMLYRQHGNNSLGADAFVENGNILSRPITAIKNMWNYSDSRVGTTRQLLNSYNNILSPEDVEILNRIVNIKGSFANRIKLIRNKELYRYSNIKGKTYRILRMFFGRM